MPITLVDRGPPLVVGELLEISCGTGSHGVDQHVEPAAPALAQFNEHLVEHFR